MDLFENDPSGKIVNAKFLHNCSMPGKKTRLSPFYGSRSSTLSASIKSQLSSKTDLHIVGEYNVGHKTVSK